jgi:hypothetical protein
MPSNSIEPVGAPPLGVQLPGEGVGEYSAPYVWGSHSQDAKGRSKSIPSHDWSEFVVIEPPHAAPWGGLQVHPQLRPSFTDS